MAPLITYSLVSYRRTGRFLKRWPILHTGSFVVVRLVHLKKKKQESPTAG